MVLSFLDIHGLNDCTKLSDFGKMPKCLCSSVGSASSGPGFDSQYVQSFNIMLEHSSVVFRHVEPVGSHI